MGRKFKGTQGKWTICFDNIFKLDHKIQGIYNSTIATIHTKNCTRSEEGRANAQLISKAPEMLEKLKEIVENYYENKEIGVPFINALESLIKEATDI